MGAEAQPLLTQSTIVPPALSIYVPAFISVFVAVASVIEWYRGTIFGSFVHNERYWYLTFAYPALPLVFAAFGSIMLVVRHKSSIQFLHPVATGTKVISTINAIFFAGGLIPMGSFISLVAYSLTCYEESNIYCREHHKKDLIIIFCILIGVPVVLSVAYITSVIYVTKRVNRYVSAKGASASIQA